jgi:hypothetical protein
MEIAARFHSVFVIVFLVFVVALVFGQGKGWKGQ